jgi:hypothetical protein
MTATLIFMTALLALQTASPGLQKRPAGDPADQTVKVTHEAGTTVLPEDAYGLYLFPSKDKRGTFGEGVQIDEQFGEVTGYLTIADDGSGKNKLSSYFLGEVKGGNGHFSFSTREVHGLWYSFEGHVTRGSAATPADDGRYVMEGTLTAHDDAAKTTQVRNISLKLIGQHQFVMH